MAINLEIHGVNHQIWNVFSINIQVPQFHWIIIWLVVSTPLKNISQLGLLFPVHMEK